MKAKLTTLTLSLSLIFGMASSGSLFAVESLRGDEPLTAESAKPDKFRQEVMEGGFDRSYEKQPPLIPHNIEKYHISLRQNGCLKCHSKATAEKENTKPTPKSHFLTRDGKKLDRLSTRRYFCNQCHVPQMNATPLVQNIFEGD